MRIRNITCMVVNQGAEQRQHVRHLSSILFAFDVALSTCCCWWKEWQRRHVRYLSSILFAYDIHWIRIRNGSNLDPEFWWPKTEEKNRDLIKNCYLLIGPSYRRSLPSSKENIQHFRKWNLLTFFLYVCGSFFPSWIRIRIADPDPADPQHWLSMSYLAASTWCCCFWWKERYLAENSP